MAVGDVHVIPRFLAPVLTQFSFPSHDYFSNMLQRKYAGKKVHLNRVSNSQPTGHESDTLKTEPPGRGINGKATSFLHLHHSETANFRHFRTQRKCQKVLQIGRKHCGKRRNCSLRAISPFPMVISKDLYLQARKNQRLFGKGINTQNASVFAI